MTTPIDIFWSQNYIRHNMRRLEHLESLNLDFLNRSVLELGSGIGDLTTYFLDRNCNVTSLEGRTENCHLARQLHSKHLESGRLIISERNFEEAESFEDLKTHDIVFCYGLLYHISNPEELIKKSSFLTDDFFILETVVSPTDESFVTKEDSNAASQAVSGNGARMSRKWLYYTLKKYFPHVYIPKTQPHHDEFPTDFSKVRNTPPNSGHVRSIFIGSKKRIWNSQLSRKYFEKYK